MKRSDQQSILTDYLTAEILRDDFRDVIGFLNDVQSHYPDAISFVAGQPNEDLFDVEGALEKIDLFATTMAQRTGKTKEQVTKGIGQYSKTKGIINQIIADHLEFDKQISVKSEDIIVTTGAQEAFSIIMGAMLNRRTDMILIEDPCYIGVSGFARIFGYSVDGVRMTANGICLADLEEKIVDYSKRGIWIKLVYVIPDFQNPTGYSMGTGERSALLELSAKYNFLIVEDSVYNCFSYFGKPIQTIKSMDKDHRVIYVGSFSKTLFPGLRIGFIVADQLFLNKNGHVIPLSNEMAKVKAQVTNNTCTISQAIVGGILLSEGLSLGKLSEIKADIYREKLEWMILCLKSEIGDHRDCWSGGIHWNEPKGGFFVQLQLPFDITENDIIECAKQFNVLLCPMEFFYLSNGRRDQIRLTFSNLKMSQIEQGVKNLAAFLKSKAYVH